MNAEQQLSKQMQAAVALREALKTMLVGGDADTLRDMIEGETGLHEAISTLAGSIREDEILVGGLSGMIDDLEKRKGRISERILRKRAIIEQAMQIGELKKLELPDVTLSLKNVPPGLEITDESKIPSKFWKARDPVLDKTELKNALKSGQEIPGAILGNGSISLQIRRS